MVDPTTAADRVTFTLVGLLCGVGAASLSKPRFRALDYGMAVVCAGLNAWSARGGATYRRHRARLVLGLRFILAGTAPALMATGLRSPGESPKSWIGFLLRRCVGARRRPGAPAPAPHAPPAAPQTARNTPPDPPFPSLH